MIACRRGARFHDDMEPIADRLQLVDKHVSRAVAAADADEGASPVLRAVVREFQRKVGKALASAGGGEVAREAVVEVEQAGDSANVAAKADSGASPDTRKAIDLAHTAICLLKAGADG